MDWAFYTWMTFVMVIMVALVIVGFVGYNKKYGKKDGSQSSKEEE